LAALARDFEHNDWHAEAVSSYFVCGFAAARCRSSASAFFRR
jgi:hypothetical protein